MVVAGKIRSLRFRVDGSLVVEGRPRRTCIHPCPQKACLSTLRHELAFRSRSVVWRLFWYSVAAHTPDTYCKTRSADPHCTGIVCFRVELFFLGLFRQDELARSWQTFGNPSHRHSGQETTGGLSFERVEEMFTAKLGSMDQFGWFMKFLWFSSRAQHDASNGWKSSYPVSLRDGEMSWTVYFGFS